MKLDLNMESMGMKLVVLVHKDATYSLYFGPREEWILDHFSSFGSFDEMYYEHIQQYRVDFEMMKEKYDLIEKREDFSKSEVQYYFVPFIIIDFNTHIYLSNFYDQALEDRMVGDWKGFFIENKSEFLNHIPSDFKYWDNDFSLLMNDQ